jgi:AcrR family transcriptional regulator
MSRLSRQDWEIAALEALAAGGLQAVVVESLASRLGATKGSFYWHFASRSELVSAALQLWERRSTDEVIARVESDGGEPGERLRRLFSQVFSPGALTRVDVALLAHGDDDLVRDAVHRVTGRRLDYVASLLRQSGLKPRAARRRAAFAYSAFLGNLQLMHAAPDLLRASVGSLSRYADDVVATLVPDPGQG